MHANISMVPPAATLKVTTSIVVVDQQMAARWLSENNPHNRPISESRVNQYVSDMEAGRWQFNGETIQFDKFGALLNGQHRLTAIVQSGVHQTVLIVRGLEPSTQLTMDQGTRRSPADQLHIARITADATVAAAIRVIIKWNRGLLFGDQKKAKVTTPEVVTWAQGHSAEIILLGELTEAGVRRVPCQASIALAVALRMAEIEETEAVHFFTALRTGESLANGSPVLTLRQRFLTDRDKNIALTERDTIAFLVIAWNAYREHRSMTKIQRPKGGIWTPENFPVPK